MTTTTPTATESTTTTTPAADSSTEDTRTQDLHARSDAQVVALLRQWVEDYQAHPEEHSHFPSVARMFFEAVKALRDEEKRRAARGTHSAQDDMAARRQAHEEALVELDRNGDIVLDFGDGLHLITVLQRAIAAHDITLFGYESREEPIDACHGYNEMQQDAEALAHLAKVFYDSEWRSRRRLEAGITLDD